jgi:hypothetical protein
VDEGWCDELDQHAKPLAVVASFSNSTRRSQFVFLEAETKAIVGSQHDALEESGRGCARKQHLATAA